MSLATWKKEFYPTPASRCSKKNAIAHSLRKWQGLTKRNLKKHGLYKISDSRFIRERFFASESMEICGESCSLCAAFYDPYGHSIACEPCPIYQQTGSKCFSQYGDWVEYNEVRPMLTLLRKVARRSAANRRSRKNAD